MGIPIPMQNTTCGSTAEVLIDQLWSFCLVFHGICLILHHPLLSLFGWSGCITIQRETGRESILVSMLSHPLAVLISGMVLSNSYPPSLFPLHDHGTNNIDNETHAHTMDM